MRVIVSKESFSIDNDSVWQIHKLLVYAREGRHTVFFDSPSTLSYCLDTVSPEYRSSYESAIKIATRAAITLPANVATVRIKPVISPKWEDPVAVLPLNEALILLDEPLGILVENSSNDWLFLQGMLRRSERERIQYAVGKRWVEPVHGGGNTLKKQLESRLNVPNKGLRNFVVFDSDRLHPNELSEDWSPKRQGNRSSACQAYEWEQLTREKMPLRYWMLRRRFIESYFPDDQLGKCCSIGGNSEAVKAFLSMGPEARWYFNMKEGFQGDDKRHDKDRCGSLYSELDAADRAALQNGFGSKLADHYHLAVLEDFNWDAEARQEASKALSHLMRLL